MAQIALDHIIILLPHKTLTSLPSSLISKLTVIPGGTHADGKTWNKLIVLPSGVYLELIAFVDDSPSNRENHWWGNKAPGTAIDWALTSKAADDIEPIRAKLRKAGLPVYGAARAGGRKREDGEHVKWEVTFPPAAVQRGSIPFWCHDVTARELRVPVSVEGNVRHASKALGVKSITIAADPSHAEELFAAYSAILGEPERKEGSTTYFRAREPVTTHGAGPLIILKVVENDDDDDDDDDDGQKELVRLSGGAAAVTELVLLTEKGNDDVEDIVEHIGDGHIKIGFSSSA